MIPTFDFPIPSTHPQTHVTLINFVIKNFVIKGVYPRDHLFPNECEKDCFHTIFITCKFFGKLGNKIIEIKTI
jgi:hypothetical protein